MIIMKQLPLSIESNNSQFSKSKKKDQLNLQAITLWVNKKYFILEPSTSKSGITTILQIERATKKISQLSQLTVQADSKPHYFSVFIGIINLNQKKVIVLAQTVSLILTINERDVFRVIKPVYIFYDQDEQKKITQEQSVILLNLTLLLQRGIFFSFSYNLTHPIASIKHPELQNPFNWANSLQIELSDFSPLWRVQFIQGFTGKIQMIINGLKICIVLISRRSIKRSHTHNHSSGFGIDFEGNVANFVETQLILNVNEYFFSFLQVRGSVPLFCSQQEYYGGVSTSTKFYKTLEQNNIAFLRHIQILKNRHQFSHVSFLNLLNQNNYAQKELIQNFQYIFRMNFDKNFQTTKNQFSVLKPEKDFKVHYSFFDIHSRCSNKQYKQLFGFIQKDLRKLLCKDEFTVIKVDNQKKKREVLNHQKGILRTNCNKCIDRSNIAQLCVGVYMIGFMLKHIGIQIPQFQNGIDFIQKDDPFANLYRDLWADNADLLSKQYTGTGSTQSIAIRKGKLSYLTTIDHGMKSLTRAIRNFSNEDQNKNAAIQFMSKYKQPTNYEQKEIDEQNRKRENFAQVQLNEQHQSLFIKKIKDN